MADLISMLAAVAGAGEEADEDFNQTVLLLHGDGTNGAQNNTFLDGSTNNFTITRNGNTTQGTFSPFSVGAGEWGNFFDGNGDYLSIARNSAFLPGASTDFTIEAWVYVPSVGAEGANIIGMGEYGDRTNTDWVFTIDTGRTVTFYLAATNIGRTTTATINLNSWNHVAVSRTGTGSNNLSIYINGVGQNFTETGAFTYQGTSSVSIGADVNGNEAMLNGYISNLRMINGTGIYSGASITVPTAPLTAISNTILLTCQSNRFVDNSTNAFAITRNGDVRVTPFSPFAPSAAYSASTNGGSGYFDGNGDYLSVPDDSALELGSGDFTIESWIYISGDNADSSAAIIAKYSVSPNPNFMLRITKDGSATYNKFILNIAGVEFSANFNFVYQQWYHVAAVRNSSALDLYINGVDVGGGAASFTVADSSEPVRIGSINYGPSPYYWNGYISSLRVVKSAVYTAAFTPPTAPLTAISNTSLLLNFTNAGIFDNTGKNNLETVGNAQIDTTTKKYGTGSMEFDGTGDYLQGVVTQELNFGTGNFTIEGWINVPASDGTYRCILSIGNPVQIYNRAGTIEVYFNDEDNTSTYIVNGMLGPSSSISANTWHHFAVVRNGTTFTAYVDGVAGTPVTGVSAAVALSATPMKIGFSGGNTLPFTGFIDDLRITKGVARYTANYSAPGKAFPDF